MDPALWVAKTGLDAQQKSMQVTSNNLANVNTNGFKKDRANFEDLFYQTVRQPGSRASQDNLLPSGLMLGTGSRVMGTEKIHSQGNVQQTERSLDVAIEGKGFFQILRPDGQVGYTRDGAFQLNENGEIVTSGGYLLEPAIQVPEEAETISIGSDGTVSAKIPGDEEPEEIGQIELADFINPSGLEPVGENMFLETASSGAPEVGAPGEGALGNVMQGALETSNVNIAEELVNMIENQRGFETNTRAISTTDEMLQFLNQNV
ncbi:MAG: flagellar basal-body rod protein FlgG [Halorhodospira halophila]|uniref:flagellar basal-body rod protein FlgG n=1 Tax=Halorhodospira TaxID=85108 RepID=UPI0019148634|nr:MULTISPECIES: flagellar basal-body rod protein FlgG [Halorhodospira]MBK5942837.1 flagellar basal-body rod protein FlgG [Halorhodospira halophila]MCC3750523.1 flagellar basal-body rod protein FlgG [Halorhodospira halophila]MCG5528795.1 flagellar basal-body rod protein FlgG [Halorhodospira halophila]MCG5533466.1 flagellar basal-body rod protein FlgG [Halorhodospira sp. 9621]MCG5538702.1 flagellar basal-body rod protein FlgG [Halorhodospira sp. 9622]